MITASELQSSLQLIDHHVEDAIAAMGSGEEDILEASLRDIVEITEELRSYLPGNQDIGEIADGVEAL